MNEKRLIVNADDLGMNRGITDAILIAHRHGIVTSASLMANMRAAEYAIGQLRRAPRLGVGVHLNICQGRPLLPESEVSSLLDAAGNFLAPGAIMRKLWRWQAAERQIEAEFRAQIQWMKNRGIHPTHADSHHHMHLYPAAIRPFARAVQAEGIPCARSPRCGVWPKNGRIAAAHRGTALRRVLVQSYRSALQSTVLRGVSTPDSRVSCPPSERGNLDALRGHWKAAFENLPEGTFELVCHPGIAEPGFSEADAIGVQRELELRVLMDPELRVTLDRCGVALITYRELGVRHAARAQAAGVAAS